MPEYLVQGIVAFWATCLPMLTDKELSEILCQFLLIVRQSFFHCKHASRKGKYMRVVKPVSQA